MGVKTESRAIEGFEITITEFPAMAGFRLFTRLGKTIAPALKALGDAKLATELEKTNLQELAPALGAVLESLAQDPELAIELLKKTSASMNGKEVYLTSEARIDQVFGSNLLAFMLTLKFALEVNFSSFFDRGLDLIGESQNGKVKDPDPSDSPMQ